MIWRRKKARQSPQAAKKAEEFTGCYVEPTLFTNVTNDMRIAREEIFGPVLSAMKFDSEEEALSMANDTEYA